MIPSSYTQRGQITRGNLKGLSLIYDELKLYIRIVHMNPALSYSGSIQVCGFDARIQHHYSTHGNAVEPFPPSQENIKRDIKTSACCEIFREALASYSGSPWAAVETNGRFLLNRRTNPSSSSSMDRVKRL